VKLCLTGSTNSITLPKSSSKLEEKKILADVMSLIVLTFMFSYVLSSMILFRCNETAKPLKSPLGNVK